MSVTDSWQISADLPVAFVSVSKLKKLIEYVFVYFTCFATGLRVILGAKLSISLNWFGGIAIVTAYYSRLGRLRKKPNRLDL